MKNSLLIFLCITFHWSLVLNIRADNSVLDAQSWENLKRSGSITITSVAENCHNAIIETSEKCKASISQSQQNPAQAVEEVTHLLISVTKNIHEQFSEIGNRIRKRLENLVNNNHKAPQNIKDSLNAILQTQVDENNQLIISIKQFFSNDYNPTATFQGFNTEQIEAAVNGEISRLENVFIQILAKMNEGITIAKDIQSSVKSSGGDLPGQWSQDQIETTLTSCLQITAVLQSLENTPQGQSAHKPFSENTVVLKDTETKSKDTSVLENSEESQEIQDDQDGVGNIFENTKRKMLKHLVVAIRDVRESPDVKSMNSEVYETLQQYQVNFQDLNNKVSAKIIDFVHQFIKLFHVILTIMENINPDMKHKMEVIFSDHENVDTGDMHYLTIMKYLSSEYMNDKKVNELFFIIENSLKSIEDTKTVQRQIIKQLSLLTNGLIGDIDSMKSTVIYILLEIKKGVVALQNLKNKSNITGIRYLFNYYKGTSDLTQLKNLVNIINALNVEGSLEEEIISFVSSNKLSTYENLTKFVQKKLSQESKVSIHELVYSSHNVREVHYTAYTFVKTYNSIIKKYANKTRKIVRHIVMNFIRIYEEFLIIIKRRKIQNFKELDEVMDNANEIGSEVPLVTKYLSIDYEIDIEKDTGIYFNKRLKDITEAKQNHKQTIEQLRQSMSSELTELHEEIRQIIETILNEAQNFQQLKEVQANEDYTISTEKLINLERIMKLANTLHINHGDIINGISAEFVSSNKELEKYLTSAKKHLRMAKTTAEQSIEKCTTLQQIQTETKVTVTNIHEIISTTASEIKSDIHQYITQYNEGLSILMKSSDTVKLIEQTNCDSVTLDQCLIDYIQDRYATSILEPFMKSVVEVQDIEKSKQVTTDSLQRTVNDIEEHMDLVKSEAMKSIFDALKQATDTVEELIENRSSSISKDKLALITSTNNLIKMLNECINVDTSTSNEEVHAAIDAARKSITEDYGKAVEVISSITNESELKNSLFTTVQQFESTYNIMRQTVKSRIEQCSSSFYEHLKQLSTSAKDKNTEMHTLLQTILTQNNSSSFKFDTKYKKFLSVVQSECYKSASAVTMMHEQIQGTNIHLSSEQCLQEVESLKSEVSKSINNIEELTNFIYEVYEQGNSIIQTIETGSTEQLSESEIIVLINSLLISQIIIQNQHIADFTSAHYIINEDLKNALQIISSTNDQKLIQATINNSIEKYDTISTSLREEVMQKFMKTSTDFTTTFETIMEEVKSQNSQLELVLQYITEKKNSHLVSEKYQKFEKYFNSDSFTTTTPAKNIYQQLNKKTSTKRDIKETSKEQLEEIVTKINENLFEMDMQSTYYKQNFVKGNRILQCIKNGQTELSEIEIGIMTECTMLSQTLLHQDSHNVQSMDAETAQIFCKAKSEINSEYKHIVEVIKSTTDEQKIERALSTGVSKYDQVFNNMCEEVTDNFCKHLNEFACSYDAVMNFLETSNSTIRNIIQDIHNGKTSIKFSEKYMQIETFIKSPEFSYNTVVHDLYTQLQKELSPINSFQEKSLENLDKVTTEVKDYIAETSGIQQLVTEVFKEGSEVLINIKMASESTLNEKQMKSLQECFRISQLLSKYTNTNQQIEKTFTTAQNNIEKEHASALNTIRSIINNEEVKTVELSTVNNYNSIYNILEEEVQKIFKQKAAQFTETFNNILKSTSIQQNTELYTSLQNIHGKNKQKQFSSEYKKFESHLFSEVFSSKLGVIYAYQNIKVQHLQQFESYNEECITYLDILTNNVTQSIREMNKIGEFVQKTFQKSIDLLAHIERNSQETLDQQQIQMLLESINISEIISFTCNSFSESEREAINQAEMDVIKEYEHAVTSIKSTTSDTIIKEFVQSSVCSYETSCAILCEDVVQSLTEQSEKISSTYMTVVEKLNTESYSSMQIILQDIQSYKSETYYSEAYKYFQLYLENISSVMMVFEWYTNLKQGSTLTAKEQSLIEVKELTSKVNHYITETNNVLKYVNQMVRKCEEIFSLIESSNTEHLSQEQMTTLSESIRVSELISTHIESQKQERALFSQAQTTIEKEYEIALNSIKTSQPDEAIEKIMMNIINSYDSTYNQLQQQIKQAFSLETSKMSEKFQSVTQSQSVPSSNIISILKNSRNQKVLFEDCTTLKSYLTSESFTSSYLITAHYFKLENEQTNFQTTDYQGKSITELEILTTYLKQQIITMATMQQLISRTFIESRLLLNKIEKNELQMLTEDQSAIITKALEILEIVSFICNSKSQSEETLFHSTEKSVVTEYEYAVNSIRSAADKESVSGILSSSIQNFKMIYTNLQQEVKNTFLQYSTEFSSTYTSVLEKVTNQQNKQIQEILGDIKINKKTINSDTYTKLETFIVSKALVDFIQMQPIDSNLQTPDIRMTCEHSIKSLRKTTNEINQKIIEINTIRQTVSQIFQQSINILMKIETGISIQSLAQEEIEILQESMQMTKVIDIECSSKIQSQEKRFMTYETNINTEYINAANAIRSATNKDSIEQAIRTTIESYKTTCRNLQKEVRESLTESTAQYSKMYYSVFKNQELKSTLQSYKTCFKTKDYKKFESYITKQEVAFNEIIEKNHNTTNFYENGTNRLDTLTSYAKELISEIYLFNKYINVNIEKSTNILKTIQEDSSIKLTEEEIEILTETLKISERVSIMYSSQNQIEEELFVQAETDIKSKYETAINKIRSSNNTESTKHIIRSSAQYYDHTFNSLKEEVKEIISKSSSEYVTIFASCLKAVQSQRNIQTALRGIQERKANIEVSEEYKQFENVLQSEAFISTSFIEKYCDTLEQESSQNIEIHIKHLNALTTEVNQHITVTNEIRRYVSKTFKESSIILKAIQEQFSSELTKEQIEVLNEGMLIYENLKSSNSHSTRSIYAVESEVISKTKSDIIKEMENTIEIIKSASDENCVKEALNICVDHYDSLCSNVFNNIKNNIQHSQEKYSNEFSSIQQKLEISNNKTAKTWDKIMTMQNESNYLEINEEYRKFSLYIDKGILKYSAYVRSISQNLNCSSSSQFDSKENYETTRESNNQCNTWAETISGAISSQINMNYEAEIQQLTIITEKITLKLEEIQFIENYITGNYQKSTEILKTLSSNNKIELTEEEINILQITAAINKKLLQECICTSNSKSDKEINVHEAQNQITQICENTIHSIKSMADEKEVQEAVFHNIAEYNNVYNEVKETVKIKLSHESMEFNKYFQQIILSKSEHEHTHLSTIHKMIEKNKEMVIKDENFVTFVTYIESEEFNSKNAANIVHQHVQQSNHQHFASINEKVIYELEQLTTEVNHKLIEIDETAKYVHDNINQGNQIMQKLHDETELSEEELLTLTKCVKITEVLIQKLTINHSEISLNDTSISNTVEGKTKIDIAKFECEIQEVYNTTIVTINLLETEEKIKEAVETSVEKYNTIHNEVRKEVESKILKSISTFEQNFNSDNQEVKQVLKDIKKDQVTNTCCSNEKLQKLESYIKSERFKSASTIQNLYQNLKQHEEKNSTATNINESGIKGLEIMKSNIEEDIKEMDKITEYVTQTLQKGEIILKAAATENNYQLTEEQKQILVENFKITQIIKQNMKIESEIIQTIQMAFINNETNEVNFQEVHNTVTQNCDTTINLIKSKTDEKEIDEIIEEQTHSYDTIYNEIRQITETKVYESSNYFMTNIKETFNHTNNYLIQEKLSEAMQGKSHKCEQSSNQTEEDFQEFEKFINSDTYKTRNITQLENTSTKATTKEEKIQKMEIISEKINNDISFIEKNTKYILENFDTSNKILENARFEESQLSREEVKQLSKCIRIAEILSELNGENSDYSLMSTYSPETIIQASEIAEKTTYNVTEIQKSQKTVMFDEEIVEEYSYTIGECVSIQPQPLIIEKCHSVDIVFLDKLLVKWEVTQSKDYSMPAVCRNLNWTDEKFKQGGIEIMVSELSEVLKISRRLISTTIEIEIDKVKLAGQIHELLSCTTVCCDNIEKILQKLSYIVGIEGPNKYLKINFTKILNKELRTVYEIFSSLKYSKKTNLLAIIDREYNDVRCENFKETKNIVLQKFEKMKSITNKILNNIDCLILVSLHESVKKKHVCS